MKRLAWTVSLEELSWTTAARGTGRSSAGAEVRQPDGRAWSGSHKPRPVGNRFQARRQGSRFSPPWTREATPRALFLLLVLGVVGACSPARKSPAAGDAPLPEAAQILQGEDRRDPARVRPLLADPRPRARARAALALGRIAAPEDVARLVELLQDPQPEVRASAAFALGLTGERSAVDSLRVAGS